MNKNILKYQETDLKLKDLENNLLNNESLKKVNQSKDNARISQEKMLSLNSQAINLINELNKLLEVKNKGISVVEKHIKSKVKDDEINSLLDKLNQTNKQLNELAIRIKNNEAKMQKLLKDFDDSKKQILINKKIYEENKQKYENFKIKSAPEIAKVKNELLSLEKSIKPEVIAKYKSLRKDNIMPVFVKLNGKNCGYCRVELPIHKLNKLKISGYTECEHCRRIIYDESN